MSYGYNTYTNDNNIIVRGIQLTYGSRKGTYHGFHGNGVSEEVCNLAADENIAIVEGSEGVKSRDATWVQQIKFHTTSGKICGPYGGKVGKGWSSSFSGCNLYYISGTVLSQTLSSINFHWKCDNDTFPLVT